jgi:hypothetical protein
MENTFVLLRSNISDQSDWMPVSVSKNKDWLVELIPNEFELVDDGTTISKVIPTFLNKKSDEMFEIRTVEEITEEPYKGLDLYSLTKKRFKELAAIHVYGRGQRRRVKLFIDWRDDYKRGAIGYKYCLTGYGVTKKQILDDAYEILINKDTSSLMWYDYREAKTEKDRFKVPITA